MRSGQIMLFSARNKAREKTARRRRRFALPTCACGLVMRGMILFWLGRACSSHKTLEKPRALSQVGLILCVFGLNSSALRFAEMMFALAVLDLPFKAG